MKTLIVGIGNDLLGDEGAGLLIARHLYALIACDDIDFVESPYSGSKCLDCLYGYERAIIIGVYYDKNKPVGDCYKITVPDTIPLPLESSHGEGFLQSLGASLGSDKVNLRKISIYAIAAKERSEFSQELTKEMKEKIPRILEEIVRDEFMGYEDKLRYA